MTESEGYDRTFQLPLGQDDLINVVRAANKNTIVALTSGGGVDMSKWLDRVPALVETWYAGQESGTALGELLVGAFSPSGKLPATFERRWEDSAVYRSYYPTAPSGQATGDKKVIYSEGVFVGYRHFDQSGRKPLFPFGYGLSYTKFKLGALAVTPDALEGDAPITVAFDVTNAGHREGAEVVQVYVGDKHAPVPRPPKELKGFVKVSLAPGRNQARAGDAEPARVLVLRRRGQAMDRGAGRLRDPGRHLVPGDRAARPGTGSGTASRKLTRARRRAWFLDAADVHPVRATYVRVGNLRRVSHDERVRNNDALLSSSARAREIPSAAPFSYRALPTPQMRRRGRELLD